MSEKFYVFHATPMNRARIHRGHCVHCREGKGQENQQKNGSGATGWNGPFPSAGQAELFAFENFEHYADFGFCAYCCPKERANYLKGGAPAQ